MTEPARDREWLGVGRMFHRLIRRTQRIAEGSIEYEYEYEYRGAEYEYDV